MALAVQPDGGGAELHMNGLCPAFAFSGQGQVTVCDRRTSGGDTLNRATQDTGLARDAEAAPLDIQIAVCASQKNTAWLIDAHENVILHQAFSTRIGIQHTDIAIHEYHSDGRSFEHACDLLVREFQFFGSCTNLVFEHATAAGQYGEKGRDENGQKYAGNGRGDRVTQRTGSHPSRRGLNNDAIRVSKCEQRRVDRRQA